MTMLPRVKGIPYGLTKLPTHNYIVSIASLVQCCVNLFEDSPINNDYQQVQVQILHNFVGVPFLYIYVPACFLRPHMRICVCAYLCMRK